MTKRRLFLLILILAIPLFLRAEGGKAKYVFYFIGDGMGINHVTLGEYWSAYNQGAWGSLPLNFSAFESIGFASSFSASNLITDSAAGGTALATGEKTNNGMLAIASDSTTILKSVATAASENGFRVGITTTVGLNHATPAAFYSHNINRENYYQIASEICTSNFEFFAGGGIIDYKGKHNYKKSIYKDIEKSGYTIAFGLDEYHQIMENRPEKILMVQKDINVNSFTPALRATKNDMQQKDLISSAIEFLYTEDGTGFFLMSESGMIDWFSHGNRGMEVAAEVLSLAEAVDVALSFYNEHPDETLIVVTADHETGGLSLADESGYHIYFDKWTKDPASDSDAHIGWTTSAHSAANVPIFAIGVNSELFRGRMDNTDIPKKICEAMGITL